jgi:hypothetical protein
MFHPHLIFNTLFLTLIFNNGLNFSISARRIKLWCAGRSGPVALRVHSPGERAVAGGGA